MSTVALSHKNMGGLKVVNLGAGTDATDAVVLQQLQDALAAALSRANHTGSQTSSTISDFDTQVRTTALHQLSAPTGPVALNSQRITGQADPVDDQDGATKSYVDSRLSGLVSGQVTKGSVRAAVTTNVDLAAPGANLDGLAAAPGDVFLLTAQTVGTQNGPYTWNGAAVPMTRAVNWNSDAEAVRGSYWIVAAGTRGDQFALLTNDTDVVLGTTVPTFTFIAAITPVTDGYTAVCPSTSAGATWTVTHNLGSRHVIAQVARAASPYDFVDVRIERTTVNTVSVLADVALAAGEFEIMIKKVA